MSGWAIDPNTTKPIPVHVYVDGKAVQTLTANTSRPDVGNVYGMGDNHGFLLDAPVKASAGNHQVCVYAIDSWSGTNPLIACRRVTVP